MSQSPDLEGMFNQAIEIWLDAESNTSNPLAQLAAYRNALALMQAVIKASPEPLPRVWALMSMIYYDCAAATLQTGSRNAAKENKDFGQKSIEAAKKALSLDPLEFRAQFILTVIASDLIMELTSGVGQAISGGAVGLLSFGSAKLQVKNSRDKFAAEATALAKIATQYFNEYQVPASEYLYIVSQLKLIADFCIQNNFQPQARLQLQAILAADETDILFDDLEGDDLQQAQKEFRTVRMLAQAQVVQL